MEFQCVTRLFTKSYDYMKKYCISPNNLKDKDNEESAFIGLKEVVLYMMIYMRHIV